MDAWLIMIDDDLFYLFVYLFIYIYIYIHLFVYLFICACFVDWLSQVRVLRRISLLIHQPKRSNEFCTRCAKYVQSGMPCTYTYTYIYIYIHLHTYMCIYVPAGASNPPHNAISPSDHLHGGGLAIYDPSRSHMLYLQHVTCWPRATMCQCLLQDTTGFPVWSGDSSLSWDFLGIFWQFQVSSVALFCFSFFEPLRPGCDPLSVSSFVSLPCRLLHCYGRLGFDLSLRIYPWQSSWTSMEFFESRQSESSPFCRCRGREGQGKNMKKW